MLLSYITVNTNIVPNMVINDDHANVYKEEGSRVVNTITWLSNTTIAKNDMKDISMSIYIASCLLLRSRNVSTSASDNPSNK